MTRSEQGVRLLCHSSPEEGGSSEGQGPACFLEERSKLGWEGPQAGAANTWGRQTPTPHTPFGDFREWGQDW